MNKSIFISKEAEPIERWIEAFPDAVVLNQLPEKSEQGSIVWLVNQGQWLIPMLDDAKSLGVSVVVMSATPNETEAFAAVAGGAAGYCHHLATPEQLQEIATVIKNGGVWVGADLLQRLLMLGIKVISKPKERELNIHKLNMLSVRERAVAVEIAHGASNKVIAKSLSISERTVKAHLTATFEKLGVSDRVQLALLLNEN